MGKPYVLILGACFPLILRGKVLKILEYDQVSISPYLSVVLVVWGSLMY